MSYLSEYKKEDFVPLSWDGYGGLLEELYQKVSAYVEENAVEFDAVVPILRGGAFPGTYLAYRFGLMRVLPVQYHYIFEGDKLELCRIQSLQDEQVELFKNPTFLLVENNHCFGITASCAAKDIKEQLPEAAIIYAADHMDYSYQKNDYADMVFYGRLTNETRELSPEECAKLGIENKSYLFPWEQFEEEWSTVQGQQYKYKDLEQVKAKSQVTWSTKL